MEFAHVAVVVTYEDDVQGMTFEYLSTMAQVREEWQRVTNRPISVAFFSDDRYLADDVTVGEALPNPLDPVLRILALPKSKYWLQVLGFEETNTLFEVAAILTPAAVRRELQKAVNIDTDDFRLTLGGAELDWERSFNDQSLTEEAELMIDLRVTVKVRFTDRNETNTIEYFASDSIGDLRQTLSFTDDMGLVVITPYRRVLDDRLRVCYVVSEPEELEKPVDLIAERKVTLAFEPITLQYRRQQLRVFLSWTPLDVYDLVSESFQLRTEFRLAVHGQALDNSKPLLEQLFGVDDVIQIDILRPCLISDLWEPLLDVDSLEFVYLYSTESSYALYLRDEISNQRVYYDDVKLTIFGSVIDVLGPISGQEKPVLLIDRDVQRNFPMLMFDGVMWRLGWATDMLLDVVPMSRGLLPKEITRSGQLLPAKNILSELRMAENILTITDPKKVFISFDKKLQMHRFAPDATSGDVRARMQQMKGSFDVALKTREGKIPDEAMGRKLDLEILSLESASRCQTKLTVTMDGKWFECSFEPQQVSFTDVMISVGKQAEVLPRHLFSKALFCCGCGRQLTKQEESHQAIPATCCSIKSLQLTDRRVKDVGIQTQGTRRSNAQTYTLDNETRDACEGTESMSRRAVVKTTPEQPCAVSSPPVVSFRVFAVSPDGELQFKKMKIGGESSCKAFVAAVENLFTEVRITHPTVIFVQEMVYFRKDKSEGRALHCYAENTGTTPFIDLHTEEVTGESSLALISRRYLRPSSLIPHYPNLQPIVWINTKIEFFTVTRERNLEPAPMDAFTNPDFVAFLHGVKSGPNFFWQLPSFLLVNAISGEIFDTAGIPGGPKRFIYVLFRIGDSIHHANVPENQVLFVFRRAGLKLQVNGGCISYERPSQSTDLELWHIPHANSAFCKNFTDAARSEVL